MFEKEVSFPAYIQLLLFAPATNKAEKNRKSEILNAKRLLFIKVSCVLVKADILEAINRSEANKMVVLIPIVVPIECATVM